MTEIKQRLVLVNRGLLELSGVNKVEAFAPTHIWLQTNMGDLHISGQELYIAGLDLDAEQIAISGQVDQIEYQEPKLGAKDKGKNFFSRILK